MQDEAAPPGPEQDGQFPRWLFWLGIILLVLLLVVLAIWTQRTPIADNLISRELVKRNISARYDIAEIGLRTQRLENLTLGNPEQPDLSAAWVEVDISAMGFTPRVTAVRAGGVRLRGRIVDGKLLLGEIDKFRDPDSTAPFNLPDIKLSLQDARMRREDRKSVVSGKSVSVRVDLGGRSIIQKTQLMKQQTT